MRFHIHRWHTVREVDWATWSREMKNRARTALEETR